MNVVIVDDEVHCIESLIIHLNALYPHMNIVYKTNKVQEALIKLPELEFDLLFLDVEMPGLNGFQLLDQLTERKFDVIFTTAYSQYATQAFKARAFDYLMKPIDEDELKETLQDWQNKQKNKEAQGEHLNELLDYLKREGILKTKIALPISDGYEFIEVDDIMYCNSSSNYTSLFLADDKKIVVSKTLKEIEKTLEKFFFLRVHQSFLINPNYLKKYFHKDGGYLIMKNDKEIPVSAQKRKLITEFFEAVQKYES